MSEELNDLFSFYIENIEFKEEQLDKAFIDQYKRIDLDKSTGRIVAGYASTPDLDSDGETIVQKGLDISYYQKSGWLNYMHNNNPSHVIGIPIESYIDSKGFYTKAMLLNNDMANDVWKLEQQLKSLGYPRHLGFSIEGKVVGRSAVNKSKIIKAKVTNVAITHIPVNTFATFETVSKSFVPPTYDEVVGYIMKDLPLKKDLAALSASPGLNAGSSFGSDNYTGGEVLRTESLEGANANAYKGKAVTGNDRTSEQELDERLNSAYRSAHKSHSELITLLKAVHPAASENLLEEITNLVYKAKGIDNFIKIISESEVLK
jgi:hypothetical protein